MAVAIELTSRGQLTIPEAIRERYGFHAGQQLNLLDLDGVLVLTPAGSRVEMLSDALRDGLSAAGATEDMLILDLRERREHTNEHG